MREGGDVALVTPADAGVQGDRQSIWPWIPPRTAGPGGAVPGIAGMTKEPSRSLVTGGNHE
jgi:hypothetical protein